MIVNIIRDLHRRKRRTGVAAPAGKVTLALENSGKDPHVRVVPATDRPHDGRPLPANGDVDAEAVGTST